MPAKTTRPPCLIIKGQPYPLSRIESALRAELDDSGTLPKAKSGLVKTRLMNKRALRWSDIDAAFKGKLVVNGPQYKGIADFSLKHGVKSTLRGMFMECANVAFLDQRVPLPDHVADPAKAKKLESIDRKLREGNITGWKHFMPWVDPVPQTLHEFCMATGLIEDKKGKAVLPRTDKLLENISRLISRP